MFKNIIKVYDISNPLKMFTVVRIEPWLISVRLILLPGPVYCYCKYFSLYKTSFLKKFLPVMLLYSSSIDSVFCSIEHPLDSVGWSQNAELLVIGERLVKHHYHISTYFSTHSCTAQKYFG